MDETLPNLEKLTEEQKQILYLRCYGQTYKEIGQIMKVNFRRVDFQLREIYKILGVDDEFLGNKERLFRIRRDFKAPLDVLCEKNKMEFRKRKRKIIKTKIIYSIIVLVSFVIIFLLLGTLLKGLFPGLGLESIQALVMILIVLSVVVESGYIVRLTTRKML